MKNIIIFLCTLFVTTLAYAGAEINNKHIDTNKIYNEEYIQSLCDAAYYYSYIGEFSKAIEIERKAMELKKVVFGDNHLQYAKSLSSLATLYHVLNNNVKAIELEEMSLAIKKIRLDEKHFDYAQSLNSLAVFYSANGLYSKAIELGENALDIIGENHINYHNWLASVSTYYAQSGQYIKALELSKIVFDFREKMFGDNSPYYASSLSDIASCYFQLGDYNRALHLFEKAYKIDKANKILAPEFEVGYANTLENLAVCYSHIGEYAKAIEYNEEASIIFKSILGEKHPSYINTQKEKAIQYYYFNDKSKFISLIVRAIELGRETYGESHPNYARLLNILAIGFCSLGEYHKALETEMIASRIWEKTLGKNHLDFAISLKNLAAIHKKIKDIGNINKYISMWMSIEKRIISNTFSKLANTQRIHYWNKFVYSYSNTLPLYTYSFPSDTLAQCAYDGTLMSKGILLNTEIELAALIAESGDKVADELYQQLLLNRGQLNKLYEMPISERWADTDSMELATEKIEHELIERSKVYGDFTHNLTIDWKQVQAQLKEDDIAIEFLSFPIENDSVMYCALTLKKEYDSPRMIPLFEARDLAKIAETDYFTTSKLTQLVWQPLAEELQSVQNIYFAPAGELHRIAIEYLPYGDEGRYIFDYWNLYRLSSTRELAKTKSDKNSTNIALYGGLRYEAEGVKFEKDVTWGTNYLAITRALPDSIGLRAQYGYLHGTLNEVTEINALYKKNSIPTILYTGSIGTESTIKALSGRRISNLHISTHGFYYSEKEVESKQDLRHLSFLQHDDTPRYIEDKSMTRSGLLFAGANATLKGDSIPEGCDDGILTAQEIASLDFRGLDLLVLSACQTGLGEIKGDGVFGLQRGFKKAGAQTIVMSLWKVDDFATNLLMTQFYNNLLAGHSKREAFHKAQEVVRSNYPDDPHKWAGFIMLDGID